MKKQVRFVGRVYSPEGWEDHAYFTATVDRGLRDRILELQAAIKGLDVYSIAEFDYSCLLVFGGLARNQLRGAIRLSDDLDDAVEDGGPAEGLRCEIKTLEVTNDSFRWTWIPEGAAGQMYCASEEIDVNELVEAFE